MGKGRQFGHNDWTGSLQLVWPCFAQDVALLESAAVFDCGLCSSTAHPVPSLWSGSDLTFHFVPSEEQYEERFLQEETVSQQINSIELSRTQPLAPPAVTKPQRPLQRQVHLRGRPASKPTVIRGITYYKAKVSEEENDIEEPRESGSEGQPRQGGEETAGWIVQRLDSTPHPQCGLQLSQYLLGSLGQGT